MIKPVTGTKQRKTWSAWVRETRKRLGLKQAQMAERIGCSESYISRWERSHWVPSYHACEQIAISLGLERREVLEAAGYALG